MKSKRIIAFIGFVCILVLAASVQSTLAANEKENGEWVDVGGVNNIIGFISPGSGYPPVPGGKVRGLILLVQFTATTTGPAEFLDGFSGPCTFNANLDENMTGPFWFTFEWSKDGFTWAGTCNGQYNWALGAGSNRCEGRVKGPGIKNGLTINDTVTPGAAFGSYSFGRAFGLPED